MGTSASRAAAPDIEERESLLGGSSAATLGSLKAKLGLGKREPPPEPPCPCLPELSYTMRFGGFVFCFLLGCLVSFTSMSSFAGVLLGHPGPFAFKYSLGNLLSLFSYCFLVGPKAQCAGMFAPQRRVATLAYLSSLAATLTSVLYLRSFIITLCCIVLQAVAMVYYAISYIPYGHTMLNRVIGFCILVCK